MADDFGRKARDLATDDEHLTCACPHCGGLIEFPAAWAGAGTECPHCGQPVNLVEAASEEVGQADGDGKDGGGGGGGAPVVNVADVAGAFRGRVERRRPSLAYSAALGLVSVAMIALPVVYVGLVAAVLWGVVGFATGWFRWADRLTGGEHLVVAKATIFVLGLLAGGTVALFLVKPLFARRSRHAAPLALNPAAEPLLFSFIHMVADAVGARRPARVAVDCQLNASAGLGGNRGECVLRLGLPLVAALDLRQLAGVVAHELAHFNQGFGLRASRLVWGINAWLARVAYERDAWDEALEGWAREASPIRRHVVLGGARLGIWTSRLFLKVLLRAGHAVSCLLLRQMERDADRCQVAVAGTVAFEATLRRLRVLHEVARELYRRLRVGWERDRELPDDFPRALVMAEAALPPEKRQRLEELVLREERGAFSTHPPDRERLDQARAAQAAGLIQLELPAAALFVNFPALARQATVLHYEDDLRLDRERVRFVPVE